MAISTRPTFWHKRRVLVTGGAGFIGSALANRLVLEGANVYVLDIQPRFPAWILSTVPRGAIRYVRGSVTSKKTLDELIGKNKIQTVFHLAAEAIVGRANTNPARTLKMNAEGTWTLLEAIRTSPHISEVVVASSDKAYGSHATLPYTEDTPLVGLNPYDCSKSCTDLIAHMYANTFGLPIAIARCGNVYGPGDVNWSRLIPDALRCALHDRTFDLRSDGTFRRDFVYIEDIVDAYVIMAEKLVSKNLAGEAFNFGNNMPVRVLDVIEELSRLEPTLQVRILAIAQHEIHDQYLDATKARRVLGWHAQTSLRSGLQKTAAWYREHLSVTG